MTNESGDLKALCVALRKRVHQVPGPVDPVLVNPNGPQAADTIERIQADLERAVDVMRDAERRLIAGGDLFGAGVVRSFIASRSKEPGDE